MANPVSWTGAMVCIMQLETISTTDHPSRAVEVGKKQVALGVTVRLLEAAISRRQTLLADNQLAKSDDAPRLQEEIGEVKRLLGARRQGRDPASSRWEMVMTSIVAQKAALLVNEHKA